MNCIMTGNKPSDLAKDAGVTIATAWSYFTQSAPYLEAWDLQRMAPNLIARDVWSVLHQIQAESNPALGGPLNELLPLVEKRLPSNSEFIASPYKLSELRFARLCVESTCASLHTCGR
eukprot:843650-Prymnesium_polylepis.1